eukprot:SAG11_NODE_8279_length_1035_cov_1.679487_1_plen_123_part_00
MVDYTGIDGPTKPIGFYLERYVVPNNTDLAAFHETVGAHLDALQDVVRNCGIKIQVGHCTGAGSMRICASLSRLRSPAPRSRAGSPADRRPDKPADTADSAAARAHNIATDKRNATRANSPQ